VKEAFAAGAPPAYRLSTLRRAAESWPHEPEIWLALAEARADEAQRLSGTGLTAARDDALAYAARAADLYPASPRVWGRLGTVASLLSVKLGDASLAQRSRDAHTRATTLGKDHWRNWHYLGETEFRLGDFAAARSAFDLALTLYEGDAGTWAGLGNAAVRTGDVATARRAFERVVALKPTDADARRALAAVGG
jgi:tetratricopeptide (TPR) repeat protein